MITVTHITAGDEDHVLTGEELTDALHEYMTNGRCPWPMQLFRMCAGDGFVVTPPQDLEPEYVSPLYAQVLHALSDPAGSVLITRPGVILTRTTDAQLRSQLKG